MPLTDPSNPPILTAFLNAATNPTVAFVFPGQGAQRVGMARDAFDIFEGSREVFRIADAALGDSISSVCFEGPEETLTDTANAQPAILAATIAYLVAALKSRAVRERPAFVAGHSLGQYSALVASGSLSLHDAITLVRARGNLMAKAGQARPGTMAAILGLDEETVRAVCHESGAEPANFNGPTQVVVGGTAEAVEKATTVAREKGGKALPVNVAGAFHTSLMAGAAEDFSSYVAAVGIADPEIPVVSNVTGLPLLKAGGVRQDLVLQIARPVQWYRSISLMLERGVDTFVEIGPGRTLSGLLKRIAPDATAINIDSGDALRAVANV